MLIRKPRSYAEVYNDLDDEVVALFRVLQSPRAEEFREALRMTPFARREFEDAYDLTDDPFEKARRLVVRSFMGFGSDGHNTRVTTGFRGTCNRSGTTPAHDWMNLPDSTPALIARLRGVVIECRAAVQVIEAHDGPRTLFYLDPPYMPETRSDKSRRGKEGYHGYKHELTTEEHGALLAVAQGIEGMVVLSGYSSPLYEDLLSDWRRTERSSLSDGALHRTEVLWINPAAVDGHAQGSLF